MENDSVRPVPFDSHSIAAAMLRARKSPAVRELIATARRAERREAARAAANAVALVDAQAQAELGNLQQQVALLGHEHGRTFKRGR